MGHKDFVVDDDEDLEYETASSQSEPEPEPEPEEVDSLDAGLGRSWADWAGKEDIDEKLRDVIRSKGGHAGCTIAFGGRIRAQVM